MSWDYAEVVARMKEEGFRSMVLVFVRARPDVDERASEFSCNFPEARTQAEKDVTMDVLKKALFEAYVREQVEAALAEEHARRTRRHRDN